MYVIAADYDTDMIVDPAAAKLAKTRSGKWMESNSSLLPLLSPLPLSSPLPPLSPLTSPLSSPAATNN
jgi:hypothetical protein